MVCIVGWAHSRFGKLQEENAESLLCDVALRSMSHSGISADDVDGCFVGIMNNGFSAQDFHAGLFSLADEGFRHTPATRLENACATGSAAIHAARDFILSGRGRVALVVGVEKMTAIPVSQVGEILLGASYYKEEAEVDGGFAGVFAKITEAYFQRYGDQSEALARIAAKNHANAVANPYAHIRKDLGFEFCNTVSEKNPYASRPLRRTDCSLVSDGAAAIILTDSETALTMKRAIAFRATCQVNEFLPLSKRELTRFNGACLAWKSALETAKLSIHDLDLVETHDCFTIAEMLEYEAMGLAPEGQGSRVINDGISHKKGALPINPSGGLKARGHPVGATGVSMHVMAAMQLMDEAEDMQIPGTELAGVFNMGGAAVANYVSILERIK
ncbi:3-ketoacyl-CoA thiolase [hydrothermal vent metagenome]|uniref:3-ketoacyl-CoA thiolase n=1 Tax=hydrothermal vent metagenome TaxID=652676 RepID=A0A3B0RXN5_9ZZZZ